MTDEDTKKPAQHKPAQERDRSAPPEGPHARDDLQDDEKTPGTGALPERDRQVDVGPD